MQGVSIPPFRIGTRTSNDTLGNPLVDESVYRAESDGFLTLRELTDGQHWNILSDSVNPPTTIIGHISTSYYGAECNTIPIKKGDFIKLNQTSGADTLDAILWLPVGNGGLIKQ